MELKNKWLRTILDRQNPGLQCYGGKRDTVKPDSTGKPENIGTPDRNGLLGGRLRIDKTQTAIIICGMYLFFALAGNIAATKVTYFGSLVMDAGFIYSLTFTWRDLIHKQLGQKGGHNHHLAGGRILPARRPLLSTGRSDAGADGLGK